MKTIVCLDGPYGVGKSSVAEIIEEKMGNEGVEILESDACYNKWIEELDFDILSCAGNMPQKNPYFVERYRNYIEKRATDSDKIIISVMSMADDISRIGIVGKLRDRGYRVEHIILTASPEVIKKRAEDDVNRSIPAMWGFSQLEYYKNLNQDVIFVNTEGKNIHSIADEVIKNIK